MVSRWVRQYSSIGRPSTYSITKYGQPFDRRSTVEQASDVGVIEPGKDLSLVAEALQHRVAVHPAFDQLDRDPHVELGVSAFGEVDAAHPAPAKLANDPIGADLTAGGNDGGRDRLQSGGRTAGKRSCLSIGPQQTFDFRPELGIVSTRLGERRGASGLGQFEHGVEEGLETLPAIGRHATHLSPAVWSCCLAHGASVLQDLAQSRTSSTRRLRARPAMVSLVSRGRVAPNPADERREAAIA